ncbi:OmpA family protein [Litoreibacter roseus]|uniref:Membrane protein n=1 Tax=Litoreibacter roseus TaxID=2601869 RepID=A0A6N6J9Z2_9RHOB|nr:OmpA family protein [Litoreibacter roseus]GFE63071.1 membrane protein [Litoreibacter roseus]
MTSKLLITAAAVLALGACTEAQLANGNGDPNQRAKTGALIGGAIGGLVGASSDDDKLIKGVVGAGVGAAVGGVIGNQLDKQAAELRRDIPDERIRIENTGSELVVTMPQDLLFAVDSASVRSDLQSDLRALANNLRDYPDTTVNIIGHTDSTGSDSYNFSLSERRADAVSFVLQDAGVSRGRIRSFGEGETRPIASNETASGRARNRRVEIIIRPNAA